MGHLDKAVPIDSLTPHNLWVLYGKSNSGKTKVLSTFPKPILYLQVGDDGASTIKNVPDIRAINIVALATEKKMDPLTVLKECLKEASGTKYATVAVDMFSMVVNEWIDNNAVKKNKRVTQQMWGDIKTDTEELIKLAHMLAANKIVVLTCHEVSDSFEGMEDEIAPDIRPNVGKSSRTYLEGMSNYGIHTTVSLVDRQQEDGTVVQEPSYGAHLGANPFYWTKTQKPAEIKVPSLVKNPSYAKIMSYLQGERKRIKSKEE